MNEGIIDSCAGVCLYHFRKRIDQIAKHTGTGKWKIVRETQ